jgi:hypothetical protein
MSAALVDINVLYDAFENLLSIYTPLSAGDVIYPWEDPFDAGDNLVTLIQEDWDLFSEALSDERASDLIIAIQRSGWEKDSGEDLIDAGDLYTRRSSIYHTPPAEVWEEFCEEVKENPDLEPTFHEYVDQELCRAEVILRQGTILYRTRSGFECEDRIKRPYRGESIGAPPLEKVKSGQIEIRAGRLNRAGRVLFYCADREETAVSEMRPWRGLRLSVGTFRVLRDLRIVDLSRPLKKPNPFVATPLRYELEITHLLNSFASDLSMPLERGNDETGYIPCQKLSGIIQEACFDGVRYSSAMAPTGTNIALYDPSTVEEISSKLVRVTDVEIKYEDAHYEDC